MADEKVDGVNVVNPTGSFAEGFTKSDVERIYHDAHPTSWNDLVQYIEKKGDSQWHITPGEAIAMKNAFQHLEESGTPFTSNPDRAYEELGKHSGHGQHSHSHSSHSH